MLKFAILASCKSGVCYANRTKSGILTKAGKNRNWRTVKTMKMKKQVVSLLLAIFLVVCTTIVTAFAYDVVVTQDGLRFGLNECDGTATVVGPDGECSGEVKIPTIVEHDGVPYVVTQIGDGAFLGCGGITSITLPSTLRTIGDSAFRDCSGLTSIVIPRGVTGIGNDAFNGCLNLRSICFLQRSNITHIGDRAFYDCLSLYGVEWPKSVKVLGAEAFGFTEPKIQIVDFAS